MHDVQLRDIQREMNHETHKRHENRFRRKEIKNNKEEAGRRNGFLFLCFSCGKKEWNSFENFVFFVDKKNSFAAKSLFRQRARRELR
jgi:hypothetical protein